MGKLEEVVMPKPKRKTASKSRRKKHKYSFFDILIFLFACLIFGGAIYYFFFIGKDREQRIEGSRQPNNSKLELKVKNPKISHKKDINSKPFPDKSKTDPSVSNDSNNKGKKIIDNPKPNKTDNPTPSMTITSNEVSEPEDETEIEIIPIDLETNSKNEKPKVSKPKPTGGKITDDKNNLNPKLPSKQVKTNPTAGSDAKDEVKVEPNPKKVNPKFDGGENVIPAPLTNAQNVNPVPIQKNQAADTEPPSNTVILKGDNTNENVNVGSDKKKTEEPQGPSKDEIVFDYGTLPPFFKEIQEGNLQVIEAMINSNLITQEKSSNGFNALHYAASFMNVDIMKMFLEKNLFKATDTIDCPPPSENDDVNPFDGNTALHLIGLAAKKYPQRAVEAAELLITHGADIKAKDKYDYTPIFTAVAGNSIDLVENYLSKGESILTTVTSFETSLLHYSMTSCHRPMIKYLIDKGSDIRFVSMLNREPIHEAAAEGCVDGLKELILTRRVSKQTKSPLRSVARFYEDYDEFYLFGASPLHFAAKFNQLETLKFLFLIQSDFYATDENGITAQKIAESARVSKEVKDYFFDRRNWEYKAKKVHNVENLLRTSDEHHAPEEQEDYYKYLTKNFLHNK